MTRIKEPFNQGANFEHLRRVLMRETTASPVPIIELSADAEVMSAVTGIDFPPEDFARLKAMNQDGSLENPDEATLEIGLRFMDLSVNFSRMVGYDYVTAGAVVPIKRTKATVKSDPSHEETLRSWQEEDHGLIMSREDFDAYTWPEISAINLTALDLLSGMMDPGMKAMCVVMGIFEDLRVLMGFEQMAYMSIDEPGSMISNRPAGTTRLVYAEKQREARKDCIFQ